MRLLLNTTYELNNDPVMTVCSISLLCAVLMLVIINRIRWHEKPKYITKYEQIADTTNWFVAEKKTFKYQSTGKCYSAQWECNYERDFLNNNSK